ncbi:unnamed protein product [Orchesella dallaii]
MYAHINRIYYEPASSFYVTKNILIIILLGNGDVLGKSRYCTVFRCKLSGEEQDIALKTSRDRWKRDAVKSILDEIKILSFIGKHENIASIFGTYTEEIKRGVVYLATDLCELGSLQRYLLGIEEQAITKAFYKLEDVAGAVGIEKDEDNDNGKIGNGIDIKELFRFSHEIASGMEYLGSKNVAHGDICTENVLLDSQKTCKITNISVSKRKNVFMNLISQNMEPRRWKWMAHESLERCEFTIKSDIWSFAITLFEIFSLGKTPYSDVVWNKNFSVLLANGLRMSKPILASQKM